MGINAAGEIYGDYNDSLGQHGFVGLPDPVNISVAPTAAQAAQGGPALAVLSGAPIISDTSSTTLSSATIEIANASGNPATGDELTFNGQTASNSAAGFFAEAVRDSFVFAPTLGHNSATGWNPTMDAGQNGPAAFGNVAAFSSEIHDETHGHTFMADSIHDAMTAQPFAGSQLHTHHGDFHIV